MSSFFSQHIVRLNPNTSIFTLYTAVNFSSLWKTASAICLDVNANMVFFARSCTALRKTEKKNRAGLLSGLFGSQLSFVFVGRRSLWATGRLVLKLPQALSVVTHRAVVIPEGWTVWWGCRLRTPWWTNTSRQVSIVAYGIMHPLWWIVDTLPRWLRWLFSSSERRNFSKDLRSSM